MSRRNRHNRNRNFENPQSTGQEQPQINDPADELAESLGSDDEDENPDNEDDSPKGPEVPVQQVVVPELPENEEVPPKETTQPEPVAPKPTVVDLDSAARPSAPVIKFGRPKMSQDATVIRNKNVKDMISSVSKDPKMHTASGRQLIKMFDEYDKLCRESRPDDGNAHAICARKLYDIMVMCCPRGGRNSNAPYMNELIGIVFSRMVEGYGTKFKESTLLRADYRLPTPTDSMKFDAFYSCMYQLVEAAKTGQKIRFNNTALSKVLQSPAAMTVIMNIRRRLEAR